MAVKLLHLGIDFYGTMSLLLSFLLEPPRVPTPSRTWPCQAYAHHSPSTTQDRIFHLQMAAPTHPQLGRLPTSPMSIS